MKKHLSTISPPQLPPTYYDVVHLERNTISLNNFFYHTTKKVLSLQTIYIMASHGKKITLYLIDGESSDRIMCDLSN